MKVLRTIAITIFVLFSVSKVEAVMLGDVLDVVSVGKDVVVALVKAWNIIEENFDQTEMLLPLVRKTEKKIFSKMNVLQIKLEELSSQVDVIGIRTVSGIMLYLPKTIKFELKLHSLVDYLTRINVFYRNFKYYTNHSDIERATLEDFAESVISHRSGSVKSLLERIHTYIASSEGELTDTGILYSIANSLQSEEFVELSKVDKLRMDFLHLEEILWDNVYDYADNLIPGSKPELRIMKEFQIFGDKIQQEFPNDLMYGLNTVEYVYVWAKTYSELRGIYALYESFRRFQKLQTASGRVPSPEQAWIDLTQTILQNDKSSIEQAQKSITEFIVKENLYEEVRKENDGNMLCNTNQSSQQILYNLYNTIELTELKGYIMMQFSYMLLKLYDKGNFTKEALIMRDRYEERTIKSIESVKKVMEKSSKDLWRCDPKKHIPGETYLEITQLLQGYVQNEVDLNPKGTCSETCSEYTYTKSHSCFKNLYCRQQRRCNGKIINCRFIDSDMWVCPVDVGSGRRYEYIEYENGRILGRKQGCTKGTVKVDSWWRWLFWHCSYCFCICDEQSVYSDRYFNMRSVIADVENNRVITGLRFAKKNRIIHLQIQEGELLSRGKINESTIHWVALEDYKITDRYIYNGQDYHTLSWEQRSIDLDDLVVDEEHVLTGVRFKKIGTHLNFEIFMTPFHFESGKLIEPIHRSLWKDNSNTDVSLKNPRIQLHLKDPDVPTRLPFSSKPDSKSDQYVDFTHTDLDRDAAQTTVPFIDAQPVVPFIPVPLAGAGILHKGGRNSGGFITPKIITYDFSKHLHAEFPHATIEINK